jgi:hypothetical protein
MTLSLRRCSTNSKLEGISEDVTPSNHLSAFPRRILVFLFTCIFYLVIHDVLPIYSHSSDRKPPTGKLSIKIAHRYWSVVQHDASVIGEDCVKVWFLRDAVESIDSRFEPGTERVVGFMSGLSGCGHYRRRLLLPAAIVLKCHEQAG